MFNCVYLLFFYSYPTMTQLAEMVEYVADHFQ